MKTWKYVVIALALGASAARAQESSLAVTLEFAGDTVAAGGVRATDRAAGQQFSTPQEAPLFLEVLDAEGGVTYAAEVHDPRVACTGLDQQRAANPQDDKASCEVVVPAADAAALVVYRRTSDDPETGRTALVRVSL